MTIPPAVRIAFEGVLPEGGPSVDAARPEDRDRVARMLATDPADWSDEDVDIVMAHAQTTLGGPETFKWILPVWLARSATSGRGWMTDSQVLAGKLEDARFDDWPEAQRAPMLRMLSDWLDVQVGLFPDDVVSYRPEDDALLRRWLETRLP